MVESESPTVWYIRHGESQGNAGLRTATPEGTALTELGRRQAELIADYLQAGPGAPQLVVTSSYVRTGETAEPTLRRFPDVVHEEWDLHEFTFLDPARFFNSTMAERRPAVADYWRRADPDYRDGPNAESFADFISRVQSGVDELRARRPAFAAVFSHGFVMRAVLWLLLNGALEENRPVTPTSDSMRSFWRFFRAVDVPNGSVVKLHFVPAGEVLFSAPSTGHLPPTLLSR
jgi:broad specificity phosphatase PhoE